MNIVQDIATLEEADRSVYLHLFDQIVTYADKDTPIPTQFYKIFGVQSDEVPEDVLDKDEPRIRIVRRSGVELGSVGSSGLITWVASSFDTEDPPNALTYDKVKGGSIGDISYDVRYKSFHETDDRAIVAQLAERFPNRGIEIQGPGTQKFYFDLIFNTDVLGRRRKGELGGILRIIARDINIGERIVGQTVAITDLQYTVEATTQLT